MINPLLAALDEASGGLGADAAPHLELTLQEVSFVGTGRTAAMRADSPDPDPLLADALIVDVFDQFPDRLSLTFRGRVAGVGTGLPAMNGVAVEVTFPRSSNPALNGEASVVVSPQATGDVEAHVDVFFKTDVARPGKLRGLATIKNASLPATGANIELTVINLDWFLDFADEWEPQSTAKSRLAFLASVRKVVNTSGDFNVVVGTVKAPAPGKARMPVESLFPIKGTKSVEFLAYSATKRKEIKLRTTVEVIESTRAVRLRAASHLRFHGELISISHVLIGIEGGRRQEPVPGPLPLKAIPTFTHPGNLLTWSGDLGGCLGGRYIYYHYYAQKPDALTLDGYVQETASRADLIGDIDGVNMAAVYDEKLSLSDNLRAYYLGDGAAHRFSRFVANVETNDGQPGLSLEPGSRPPRLTAASRQFIAEEILMVAILTGFRRTGAEPGIVTAGKAWKPMPPAVEAMLKVDSPEVQKLTNILVNLVEAGLAAEPP